MYLRVPPRRVQRTLQAIVGSASDIRFELIPADGGCVVALIWDEEKSRWAPQALRQSLLRQKIERLIGQLAEEMGAPQPSAPGQGLTDVARA